MITSPQAREHLNMVDRILQTDRTLNMPPIILIGCGLFGALINGIQQARSIGLEVPPDRYIHLPLLLVLLATIAFADWRNRKSGHRETQADSLVGSALLITFVAILVLNVTAQNVVIPFQAMALFWSGGFSIALLIVGAHCNRALMGGGVALLAASAAASYFPTWFNGILAVGWLAGFALPGIVIAYAPSNERPAVI